MAKVTFIGLGVMGFPMAGHLASHGHDVTVYNRTQSKADAWKKTYHGASQPTPAAAAEESEFVFACVGNDQDLAQICRGEVGAFATMKPESIFVDHTTVSARITQELSQEAKASGIYFVDAPVSGGQAGAENGALSVMCGGPEDAFNRAQPIINSYAKVCRRLGETGAGQLTKMVNQICIAGLLQGLSEGLNFADEVGLDGKQVIDVIRAGAAGSWQMDNRYETMLDGNFDFGFAVDWMRKDLGICLATANEYGTSLPVTSLVDQFYKDVQSLGGGRWDTSSLIQRLRAFKSSPQNST